MKVVSSLIRAFVPAYNNGVAAGLEAEEVKAIVDDWKNETRLEVSFQACGSDFPYEFSHDSDDDYVLVEDFEGDTIAIKVADVNKFVEHLLDIAALARLRS